MKSYQETIEIAENILRIAKEFFNGTLNQYFKINGGMSDVLCWYENTKGTTIFSKSDSEYDPFYYFDKTKTLDCIRFTRGYQSVRTLKMVDSLSYDIELPLLECTEEEYFQYSTILNEQELEAIFVINYLIKTDIQEFYFDLAFYDLVLQYLDQ